MRKMKIIAAAALVIAVIFSATGCLVTVRSNGGIIPPNTAVYALHDSGIFVR